jgi:uncharacterized protein YndB with AHSA1/START domain
MSDLGIVEPRDGKYVLRYERRLVHPIQRVWSALTQPEEIVGWLAEATMDLVVGGNVELRWLNTDDQGNRAEAHGTITELDPPHLIEYDTDIHGLLRWELREAGNGTVLTFTNITPAPEEYKLMVAAGWHIHLDHLVDALEGKPVDWSRWDDEQRPRWAEIRRRYEEAGV